MKRKAKRVVYQPPNPPSFKRMELPFSTDGFGHEMPPPYEFVRIYFDQKGLSDNAENFFDEQENSGWKTPSGGTIRNWKVCAAEWIYNFRQDLKRRQKKSPFYSV